MTKIPKKLEKIVKNQTKTLPLRPTTIEFGSKWVVGKEERGEEEMGL